MKVITRYGISSKNTPQDTYDSLLLAINTDYIDGVEVNLNMTKDKEIIIYQSDSIENNPNYKIKESTLNDLAKHNLGSKVKKHRILTLKEALKLFESTSKLLILNFNDFGKLNLEMIKKTSSLVNLFPNDNVYIKSPCKEVILEMQNYIKKAKMGAVIMNLEPYFWELDLDFYSISVQKTKINECSKHIQKKLEDNRYIMMGDINDSKIFDDVKKTIGNEVMDKSYIISSNIIAIAPYIN